MAGTKRQYDRVEVDTSGKVYTLAEYIDEFFESKSDFARSQKVHPPQVAEWINTGYIVVDHVMFSQRRPLGIIK